MMVGGVFDLEAGGFEVGVELEVVGAVEDLTFELSELDGWTKEGVADCTKTFEDWEGVDETGTGAEEVAESGACELREPLAGSWGPGPSRL